MKAHLKNMFVFLFVITIFLAPVANVIFGKNLPTGIMRPDTEYQVIQIHRGRIFCQSGEYPRLYWPYGMIRDIVEISMEKYPNEVRPGDIITVHGTAEIASDDNALSDILHVEYKD